MPSITIEEFLAELSGYSPILVRLVGSPLLDIPASLRIVHQ